ncbi:capsule assembly Wzi family protein [Deminuibacter soli]|nr:capsule assembly Wzi family protein [Deminuibacter soli]
MKKQQIKALPILTCLVLACLLKGRSQTIVLPQGLDLMRRSQLAGLTDSTISGTLNMLEVPVATLDSIAPYKSKNNGILFQQDNNKVQLLPVQLTQQVNLKLPYAWNIAPMIPAKGYQALLSPGVYAQFGKHITVQVSPQLVYAANPDYLNAPKEFVPVEWSTYSHWTNTIDMPEHFGGKNYVHLYPGQSSIRYNTGKISIGVSTENMWWGPGTYNALILSNNAPGFLHGTINTIKPIETGIGSFEGQVIAGKLDNTSYPSPGEYAVYNGAFLNDPKFNQWRYMTGMIVTWQPKWVKHLSLGIAKASYQYHSKLTSPLDFLPLQGFFGKAVTRSEKEGSKASMGSLFVRYWMPSEKAEIYIEYGRGDRSLMPTGIFQDHQYPRAYVMGIRKLFDNRDGSHIQLLLELCQMQLPTGDLTMNNPQSWYTHSYVRQGYTQDGRVLGAGIGPGSNSQTLEVSWIKGSKKLGVKLERYLHNNDLYYYTFSYIQDYTRKWVDLSTTFNAEWNYKQFVFSGNLGFIRALDYQWQVLRTDGNEKFYRGYDVFHLNGTVSAAFRF